MSDPARPRGETPVRSIFDRLRAKRESALPTRIPRLARDGGAYPLSDGQERLWFIDRMLPGNGAYNIAAAVDMAGPLDLAAFAAALIEIVRRHETLRTSFPAAGGQPVQVISPVAGSPLHLVDLDGLADGGRIAGRIAGELAAAPFDLAGGALLRVGLLRLGPEEHRLVLVLHHIVSDGWSLRILLRETRLLYQAFLERRPSPLPELTVQYVDFVDWQRDWLAGDAADRQLAYWKRELGERPPVLQLPADRPRPAVQSLRGRSLPLVLPPGLSAEIGALTRSAEVTPFVTLLAAFQALLHRLSGQPEVLAGVPIANRKRPEIQDLIGFFVNTLALGARFSAGLRFRDLLRSTHEAAVDAHANQELPFGRLVKELQPARQTSHAPLVQVAFAYQNLEAASLSLPGLRLALRDVPRASAMFDLRLDLREEPLGFAGEIEYSTDLFDAATVSRWAGSLAALLAAAAADPELRVAGLPLLSAAEAQQLREANDTAVRFAAGGRCLHELIAEQAAGTPDAIAVAAEEGILSYRELAARSAQLARQLALLGVGPEVRVGICLERSRELMVGLLAVLTAGGAYVPLDPSYPRERLAYMLADSAVPVLLAQPATLSALPGPEAAGVRVVLLDDAEGAPAGGAGPGMAGAPAVHPGSLAYVIYTSGSTGRPKGVMNTHAGIVNRLLWMQAQYGLAPGDRVLQKTPVSFDVSVWELFWPLLTGACLVMARPGGHQDGAYLVRTIAEQEITTLHFVPSMLAVFLETPGAERPAALRRVLASGEALSPALAERYFGRLRAPLHNLYGPTEAAVDVTFWPCDPADRRGLVPIGRPVANTAIHLLDRDLRPVPLGVAGELHIGGVQVARGYLGRPELTAGRFVPDPWGDGARLYATGDLARRLPGGEIDYLGRLDHQVKIRGFRIELGEIEAVLGRDPEVVEAAVVAEPGRPGESARLVAYVVPDPAGSGQELERRLAGLRRRLREELPEHMVPAAFVALEALPLTPSGKVDRRALPAPDRDTRDERAFVPPRTPTEEILAAIWTEVLGIERCGVEDDFFVLGGHSLLANQVVSRIRGLLGIELPLHAFFALPTVAALAERVEAARRSGATSASPAFPPLTAGERRGDEPLSFAQQRLWFLNQLDRESTAYHVAVALRLTGALSPPALATALASVVERHETLRTTFALRPDGPVQAVAPPAGWRLPVVDLAGLGAAEREAEMHRLAQAEADRPFELARGPLLRTLLVRLAEHEHVFSLLLHHIVSDGWSMGVLWQETMALYAAAVAGEPPRLPPLPVQYRDFAAWQRRWLTGDTLERELGFWRPQLAGAPALLELPADRARPPVQRFRGRRLPFALSAVQTAGLKQLGRREGATLFMALLAAFDVLLHRYSRQSDLVVGFPIAGRRPETEGLIGLFLNTLALRVQVEGGAGWLALLRRVRDVALDAFAHQDLPFEKLVAELGLERNLAHAPLFQTLLVFQNMPAAAAGLPGLAVQPLDVGTGTAKFDLVLNVEETSSGLAGWLIYNRDLFDPATVARMRAHLGELVASLLAAPERRVDELALLGPAERQQLLTAWNDTAVPGTEATFGDLFTAQAARAPGAVALACGDLHVSYGELALQSARLARGLAARGIGPEAQVAVLAERGSDLLTAMLALWKLGAAYLPLDPHHPAARLAQTLAQSGSRLVLAAEPLRAAAAAAAATAGRPAATIGDLLGDGRTAGLLPPPPGPAGLAYVLFTSGSTGVPKGAMVEHRGMANHLAAKIADLGLTASDRVAQTAVQTFDISIWQLVAPLLAGARVDVLPDEVVRDPLALLAEIERRGLTVFETVPSLLAALLQVEPGRRPALAALRWLIPTGEALSPELCRQWFAAYPAIPLVNAYGPTECSDDVTHQILHRPPPAGAARTPIGRPVLNTRVYVLGPGEEPAPIGVPGELAVAGAQVGRGYWGRPDLTAERFVPDPFSALPGGRLYCTGDLVRLRPSGEVEFLGRIDHQVKVRGFRIELGDIEAALAAHPAVREAVVLARADRTDGDRRLAAYVVAEDGAGPAAAELRAFLQGLLPEYMVPSAFVLLPALPLTANGKVDRKALPAPEAGAPAETQGFAAPRTGLERHLAGLWAESLGLSPEQVGVHDSFFEAGGNSILGAILINRLQKTLGEIVHVVALFDHPTVAGMAGYLMADYPAAVSRLWGLDTGRQADAGGRVEAEAIELLRAIIPPLAPRAAPETRNPPAVFVLSAPRSGSTLLRIMLAGHPRLFAPPELELLSFNTMAERRSAFSGRNAFWLEGLLRAVMEIHCCGPEEARLLVERWEAEELPTRLAYRRLQEWIGERRTLVDKTPSSALSRDALERIETDFAAPLYLHLVRHPSAAIRSFEEAKLDQVFFRHAHPFSRRQLAELIWVVSHQNIVQFLRSVPAERQHWIRFEELVGDPETALGKVCELLGLPLHPDMLQPYKDVNARMADGIHAQSRMLGDVKFLQHEKVEAKVAERWREQPPSTPLGEPARALAAAFGYELPHGEEDVRRPAAPAAPPLERRVRTGEEPLSFAQQRLWFLHQLDPGSTAYHIPAALHLEGAFDPAVLTWALGQVAERQEMLRTTFHLRPGGPVQAIAPPAPWPLPVLDLSGLDEGTRQAEMRRRTAAEIDRCFDLSRGPLLRTTLFRLAGREHVLLLVLHHVISDAWSMAILARETLAFYRAAVAGRPAGLPELPVQYGDYAAWQREWLSGAALENELTYWRGQLAGAPALLELPTDRPRPAVQRFQGGRVRLVLPAGDSRSLEQLGHRAGATLFMTLLAAFDTLLYRYSGQEDLVVGFPIAGRNRVETEGLIGLFLNTLALRVQAGPEASWRDLLARVREVTLAAFLHQELPFEKLVAELDLERNLAHAPLFQTLLVLQNAPKPTVGVPGLTVRLLDVDTETAKFDLVLSLTETAGGIEGWLHYDRDLFDAATMVRMLEHLQTLLAGIVAAPERRVAELPLLTAAEQQALRSANDTAVRYARGERCLHELIAEQAGRTPDAVAVVSGQGSLSYRELMAKAHGLAWHLRTLGAGPETRVGICLERSLEMMIGLLAVLEAGAAYVPLDPTYPGERLAWMLEDSAVPVLLTLESLRAALPGPPAGTRVVCLDGEIPTAPAPPLPVDPGHLAYVIYTSGSTGRPKGVQISHRAVVNFLLSMAGRPGLGQGDTLLAVTTLSFDIAGLELYLPLITGARVVLAGREAALDGVRLAQLLSDSGATVLQATPATWRLLLESGWNGREGLRILCGGEGLPRDLADRLLRCGAALWNLYGPTETTIWSAAGNVAAGAAGEAGVPVGLPIANTQIHVLDRHLAPVPAGIPGEVYIGGTGLARGYLHRPGLTAERFGPDPFGAGGERLYRVGDLGRQRADGVLEILGRVDHQVKVRGFRIELGEIEATLASHPAVRAAVVLARDDRKDGDRRLAAYVVAGEPAGLAAAGLRTFLRGRLPEYMVPAAFVFLPALPLTPNGKVDRKALPAPGEPRGSGADAAPRTPAEELVAGIFAEVLGLESVGMDQSFFDLGGHSLLAVQVISRLTRAFGVKVPLSRLFASPAPAGLVAAVEEARAAGTWSAAPPLVPAGRSRPLPLSFAQQRLWFLHQLSPGGGAYNIPSPVRLAGRLDVPAFAASLGEVVRRHETLRTTFGKEAGAPVQRIAASGPPALPVVDLRGLPAPARELEARSLAGADAERAFDLARGPLLRAHLVALSGEEQVILLTMHHIISDGWSQGVLVQELASLYDAFSQGRPSPLPELPVQYADFACWQRQWLAGEVLDAEIAYWRERLAGASPRLELPTDRPRPAVQTFAGAHCAVSIPGPLVAELKALARSRDATLFMALLAAFQALLCRYSGQTDLSVGTPSAGRNHVQTEKLIGFFVNTLVLRTELSGELTFSGLMARVRETAIEAYLHQDLPFEMLVEQLRPERSLSHSPLFQVMLVLQNAPQGALTAHGLRLEPFAVPGTAAKLDLTLTLAEAPGGLLGNLNYNRDLFEEVTVRRLAQLWTRLVRSAVGEPESRVLEVPLLAPAERHQLVVDWNDTALRLPLEACVHRWIEAQAARAPEAAAVRFGGRELTYADLNARANRLARHLQDLGVGPDRGVGICAARSLELCVGLLAILKAGGAYVPLDPSLPAERLAFMVKDVASSLGMPVLLTQSRLLEQAARWTLPGTAVVPLDHVPAAPASEDRNLEGAPAMDNLAYVIYTSGSTGRPKAVMVPHRGLLNYLLWSAEAYGAPAGTGSLVHSALGFDLTVTSLFVPLLGGRTVHLVPEGDGVEELAAALLASRDLTLLKLTPAHLEALRGSLPAGEAAGRVRMLVIGGEALQGEGLGFWLEHAPGTRLINEYGPTETVVGCCVYEVPPGRPARGPVPIGRPVANTQAILLDRRLGLLPLGAMGELCIGGAGVARGYLGLPELTAEKFVPDAFGASPGARLYRTGDLARYLPDGRLQYLGRTDHQVKIRGFRIELGEIEAALAEHPGVRQAVVLVREGPQGDRRLAAWIVAGDEPPAPDELRQRLRSRLPEHMVPAEFSFPDSLPLTPTGKVDRRALPAPEPGVRTGGAPAAAPRDEIEHRLAGIWAEILGLEGVDVDQSFFDLGGHSLSAVRLVARIEDQLGQPLPLSAVFQAATVERMASLLRTGAPALTSARPVVVELQGGSRRPFFCVHPIGGNVFCYVPLARALGPGQPFYGLQMPDLSSAPAETLDTVEGMSRRYLEALREVQPAGPYRLGGWSMGAVVAFEMACQLRRAGEEVELVAMVDAPIPGEHRRAGDLDRPSILAGFARDLTGARLPLPVEELRQLGHERQLAQVLEWAKETRALPAGESLDRLAGLFAMFEHNLAVLGRHEPGPYPGRIELFRASDTAARHPDPGWAGLAHGGAAIHEIPGDHYSIVRRPALLAGCLRVFLEG